MHCGLTVCARWQALGRALKDRKAADGFVREVQTQAQELQSQMYEADATQVDDVDMSTLVEELQDARLRLNEAKRQVRPLLCSVLLL